MQDGVETTDLGETSATEPEVDISPPKDSEADIEQDTEPGDSPVAF